MKPNRPLLREDIFVLLIGAAACVAWTLFFGKDLHWDFLNYHYYLPFSLLEGRLDHDFFPASTQSYLNPVGYLPMYLLDRAGLHSMLTMSMMAVIHSLNIFFLYKICHRYAAAESRRTIAALSAAIGLATQPFLLEVGNTFIDILTIVPMLAAIYLLGGTNQANANRIALHAGLLFGIAAGLKPTNAIAAVPGIVFILALSRDRKLSATGLYVLGGILGTTISGGYWAYKLYAEFGSPMFPLYNGIFHAPDFPAESLSSTRFIPTDRVGILLFPFRMLLIQTWIYVENLAPDVRYALAAIALMLIPIHMLTTRWHRQHQSLDRPQVAFVTYAVVIFYAWVVSSANGRYGLPQLLLVGPLLLVLLQRILPGKMVRGGLLIILVAQLFMLHGELKARWAPSNWSRHLLDLEIPNELRDKDYLFLSTTAPSHSYLAAYFSPGSIFVNVRGQHLLTFEGAGGDKLQSLIDQHANRIRSITEFRPGTDIEKSIDTAMEVQSGMFARYGLVADRRDCTIVTLNIAKPASRILLSCNLVASPQARRDFVAKLATVDPIFDRIAKMCPELFSPSYSPTESQGEFSKRHYLDTELDLMILDGNIIVQKVYSMNMLPLGRFVDWTDGKTPPGLQNFCNVDFSRATALKETDD